MKHLMINPEILSQEATHTLNGVKVKVFMSTLSPDGTITFEFMEGPLTGRWSNNAKLVDMVDLELLNFIL